MSAQYLSSSLFAAFTRQRNVRNALIGNALAAFALVAFALIVTAVASTIWTPQPVQAQGVLVDETPRTDLPQVLDGTVWEMVEWNNMVVVAGEFDQVRDRNGTVHQQANIFAYDAATGAFRSDFRPAVDGRIRELAPSEDKSSLFIGGAFKVVEGQPRERVAKLSPSGNLVPAFVANATAEVNGLVAANGRLYVGGTFLKVNGVSRSKLAAVDPTSGALIGRFDMPLSVGIGANGQFSVKELDVTPDLTTLLVVHTATYVQGQERAGVALLDITTDAGAVRPWQTNLYHDFYSRCADGFLALRDGDISPDGSYFVVVGKGHDGPPVCDTAIKWPIAGGAGMQPDWISRHFDSVYSVAISNDVVYTGGHFRYQEAPWSPNPYPGDPDFSYELNLQSHLDQVIGDLVQRGQLGALDPATGKSLDWNPGNNAQECVCALEVIDGGLLVGQDSTKVNGLEVGRHARLDGGPPLVLAPSPDRVPPSLTISSPAPGDAASPMTISGTATDNEGLRKVFATIRSRNGLGWARTDGTFGNNRQRHPINVSQPGSTSGSWSYTPNLPPGDYRIYVWSQDLEKNRSTIEKVHFTVAGGTANTNNATPTVKITRPKASQRVSQVFAVKGTGADNSRVVATELAFRDLDTGNWLQPDFSFQQNRAGFNVPIAAGPSVSWSYTLQLPPGRYRVNAIAIDNQGNRSVADRVVFEVAS